MLCGQVGNQLVVEVFARADGVTCNKGCGGVENRCCFFVTLVTGAQDTGMPGTSEKINEDELVQALRAVTSDERFWLNTCLAIQVVFGLTAIKKIPVDLHSKLKGKGQKAATHAEEEKHESFDERLE